MPGRCPGPASCPCVAHDDDEAENQARAEAEEARLVAIAEDEEAAFLAHLAGEEGEQP